MQILVSEEKVTWADTYHSTIEARVISIYLRSITTPTRSNRLLKTAMSTCKTYSKIATVAPFERMIVEEGSSKQPRKIKIHNLQSSQEGSIRSQSDLRSIIILRRIKTTFTQLLKLHRSLRIIRSIKIPKKVVQRQQIYNPLTRRPNNLCFSSRELLIMWTTMKY